MQFGTIFEKSAAWNGLTPGLADLEEHLRDHLAVDAAALPHRVHHEPVAHAQAGLERELLALADLRPRSSPS